MTDEEKSFHVAIANEPRNEDTHRIFADWLDEHDRPDEAAYHRRWTVEVAEAEQWFRDMAAQHCYGDYDNYRQYQAEELIEAGKAWIDHRANKPDDTEWHFDEYTTQYGDQSLQDFMFDRQNREDFWRNWELVTGIHVPDGTAEDGYVFSCSC